MDRDGATAYSGVEAVYVGGTGALTDVAVGPNPARGYVAVLGLPAGATAELRDAAGRRVGVLGFGASRINVEGLATGAYALVLRSGETTETRRVVVD